MNPALDNSSRILYSMKLYLNRDLLLSPYSADGEDQIFVITPGETAKEVVDNLANKKLIKNPEVFNDYLIYKGIDRLLKSGTYFLNPKYKPIDIASSLYDTNPEDISFSFLAGWRAEEISALLPSSGLNISAEEFFNAGP